MKVGHSIALVGSACRLPGAKDLEGFWSVLKDGRCTVTKVDEGRFGTFARWHPDRTRAGRSVTFAAGQLDCPYDFDPTYFGISPRESATMDPQQRLMLEVFVEALENAGIAPSALAGQSVGVYVGASSLDYSREALLDPSTIDPQSMTGNTLSVIANRLSYIFDLRGPSYTLDTACSASLTAMHNALEDIRVGRIDTAVVGGVSLLFDPVPFIGFSRASMLSENGLCRAFDAAADGYVRSEGAVAIVLRSEDAARANGDPIRARILASGVNADGRTAGLSLPSMSAQEGLLASVYEGFEIDPERLAFVEAHGTGTRVGDPIETTALGRVLGQRRGAPLPIGSAKTNFGHLEPASGLVGLLKAQLALANDVLPASLHFETPNPDIPFDELNLAVAGSALPLERNGTPRLAGINSFGFGGANAHVVIADGEPAEAAHVPRSKAPLVISAASRQALCALARASAARLEDADEGRVAAHVNAAAHRRDRLAHRAVVARADGATMAKSLQAVSEERDDPAVAVGEAGRAERPVFVYSGNGAQWSGMGRDAYQKDDDFRLAFERADKAFMSIAGWSLVSMLFSADLETEIERTEIAQPLLIAIQIALTEALARRGITPSAVVGHSVGEVAAAWASGALSLSDAMRVIHARSTHQEVTRHLGSMAALLLSPEAAREAVTHEAGLEVAAINSGRSVTISGPGEALDAFAKTARSQRWALKRLDLDYPFHCALVEPIREPLLASLAPIAPRATTVPMISTVTGEAIDGASLGPHYWWRNVREAVDFRAAITAAVTDHRLFAEIGPRPVLTTYINDIARGADVRASALASFRQGVSEDPVGEVVRTLIANGAVVEERALFGEPVARPDVLPPYPWQHVTYRIDRTERAVRLLAPIEHVLLGERLQLDVHEWRATLDPVRLPFLADHTVEGEVVFPAAGFVEMLLAAGRLVHPGRAVEVAGLDIVAPLALDGHAEREVRTREIAQSTFVIESRVHLSEDRWTLNVKADVRVAPDEPQQGVACQERTFGDQAAPGPDGDIAGETLTAHAIYARTAAFGLPYGPIFRRAQRVRMLGRDRADVRLAPPDPSTALHGFALDPTLFDACFHALFAFLPDAAHGAMTALPVRVGRLTLSSEPGVPSRAHVAVRRPTDGIVEADFALYASDDRLVATAERVRFQVVPLASLAAAPLRAVPRLVALARADEPAAPLPATLPPALSGSVEPSEAALFVEAGVLAAAEAALRPLVGEGRSLDQMVSDGVLAPSAAPLAARLLAALVASGAATEEGEAFAFDNASADVGEIVGLLVDDHAERAAEATLLAALPQALAQAFRDGLTETIPFPEATLDHLIHAAPFSEPICNALIEAVARTAEASREPLRVLLIGAANVAALNTLAKAVDPGRVRLVVTDRDAGTLERAALTFERAEGVAFLPFEDAGEGARFDVLALLPQFSATELEGLETVLRPGGLVVGAAHTPSLFADAVGGLAASWWDASVEPASPIGALRSVDEWRAALQGAGLGEVTAEPVAVAEADGVLFVARQASVRDKTDDDPEAASDGPALYAMGEAAERTLDALAALSGDVPVHRLPSEAEGAEAPGPGPVVLAVESGEPDTLGVMLDAVGRWLGTLGTEPRRVTLVTFGAHASGHADVRPQAAALAAFGRVAANEFPHLDVRLVDIAPSFARSEAAVRLKAELAEPNGEREVVLMSDRRSVLRYAPARREPAGEATTLDVPRRGSIDQLVWSAHDHPPLAPGDVRIAVEASGLNFRDVMWTLGLLPHEALEDGFAGPTLGMECAGTIEAVGEGVSGLAPGDPVLAFAPASFATHVTVTEDAVLRRPHNLSAEAAATMPVAFLTAYYALVELARIEEGETVLVHGGAGGVGLAALQIARMKGARVIATAGTPAKRALLSAVGASHVFSSRALTFAADVKAATGGQGVDVVLNSLAGEAMERSLDVLKPFGRFLELGKRDFYADTKLGLRPFRQNLSYFGIDADQLMAHRPALAKRVLGTIIHHVEAGDLTPLPHRTFAAADVREAFRLMQSAGHVGKIVVRPPAPPSARTPPGTAIVADAAYLLVAGTSGFGFATAEWLIGQGARDLTLASRSGVADEAVAAAIERHRAAGVRIDVVSLDVTDEAAVREAVDAITGRTRLAGVFHMAMVLDDALIASLDAERYARAMRPKIAGADALEAATRDVPLDLFVLYSSITVQLGNPGQANYVAANAYLEAVARRRRARGQPALAVAWGAISDVGVLARQGETSDLLQKKLGRHAMSAGEALGELGALLADGAMLEGSAVRLVGRIDWASARRELVIARAPAFEDVAETADEAMGEGDADLAERLAGLSESEAVAEVTRLLASEISRILKMPASDIDAHKPLTALGMDSLMGVELRMSAEQRLGIDIPLMALASGGTLTDIARKVVARVGSGSEGGDSASETLVAQHIGQDAGERDALEAAVREKTRDVRTITS